MDVLLNRKNEINVGDVTLGLAMSRDITTELPTVDEYKTKVSMEEDPSYSYTPKGSPKMVTRQGLAVFNVTARENKMVSESTQKSIRDICQTSDDYASCVKNTSASLTTVEKYDKSVSSDEVNVETPVIWDISVTKNKVLSDVNGSDISSVRAIELNSVALNISDSESGVSISGVCSDRQNESEVNAVSISGVCSDQQNESEVNAVGSDAKQDTAAEVKDEILSGKETLALSSTCMHVPSECEESSKENAGKTEVPVTDSGFSGTEDKYCNSDISKTNACSDSILPEYLNLLLEGMNVCGDSGCPMDSRPEWVDLDKFRRGQWVAMKYLFGLVLAEMLSLMMILSYPDGLHSLVFTGKSDTPFKSFKRYLSTVTRVRSWYSDDIWQPGTEGHKNIKVVRAMHETVRQGLHNTKPEDLPKKINLSGNSKCVCKEKAIWSPLREKICEDFQVSCPYPRSNQRPFLDYRKSPVFVNQMNMAVTQFGFMGLFILFPGRFGAHGLSDEDMDAFVHLWRCLGYVLGLEDRYNFCNGDLETVRQRSRDMINFWVKPNLREVSRDWEHMMRCIVEGINYYIPGITFEIALLYLCSMLGIHVPRLSAVLTFTQKLFYYLMIFTFAVIMRLPGAPSFYNWLLSMSIRKAQMTSPERLKKLEQRQYPYELNAICTRL
jgi:hypothetical protein